MRNDVLPFSTCYASLSKLVSQKIFLHCLYTVSFCDFHQYLATRTTATWINLVIILQYWQFISTHTHIVSGLSSFQELGLFWKQFLFLRTQSFWKKAWGQVVCYNRISILDIISNYLTSFFTTAAAANVLLLAEDWNASPCFSQHRSETVTVPLSVKFKAWPHVGGRDQLTRVSLQCTGKASAGEVGQRNASRRGLQRSGVWLDII